MSFRSIFVPRQSGALLVSFLVALALVIVPAGSSAALDPPASEPFTPNIGVWLHSNMWGQGGWVGPEIRIEIERPSTGDSYSTVHNIGVPSPDEWHFDLDGIWDVQPGDEFLVTDLGEGAGANVKFHRVHDFSIGSVDKASRTVSGWATPETELTVKTLTPKLCDITVSADAITGNWTHTFAPDCMPEAVGSYGHVEVYDDGDDQDASVTGWNTISTQIFVDQLLEKVSGNGWSNGSIVNVAVSRDSGSGFVEIHSDPITVDDGEGFELWFDVFDLQTEDLVVAEGQVSAFSGHETSVDSTVTGLTLAPDGLTDYSATVDGASGGDRWLVAQAWGEDGSWAWRLQEGVVGTTTFDFTEVGKGVGDDSWLTAPMSGLNIDEWEPDGEGSTRVEWFSDGGGGEPGFWFSVEAPYQVWGHGDAWPVGAVVYLTVDDDDPDNGVLYTNSASVVSMGSEPWEVGFNFNLEGLFDIEPGHVVTITSDFDGVEGLEVDRELVVADLGSVDVNAETGVVSGYAPPGAWVNVNGGNESGGAWRDVQAADESSTDPPAGYWEADLSIDLGDGSGWLATPLENGTGGSAQIFDDDGDSTHRGWCFGCDDGGGGEPGFWFSVETPYQVWGHGEAWPVGVVVDLTVDNDDDPDNGVLYTNSTTVVSMGMEPWEVGFNFNLEGLFDIEPGHVVTITSDFDGVEGLEVDRELVVADLGSVDVNAETGVVSGYAPPGAWVNVNGGNESGGAWRDVQAADESSTDPPAGYWEADLSIDLGDGSGWLATPLENGTGGSAQIFDDDGDSTHRGWCFGCDDGGGGEPSIAASVWPDTSLRGWAWQGGDLEITLDKTPDDPDDVYQWTVDLTPGTYEEDIWYNGWEFELRPPFWDGVTFEAGDVLTVTATGGESDGTVKTLTIAGPLSITAVDLTSRTVSGTAPIGETLDVVTWGDDFGRPHDEVSLKSTDGTWTATFPNIWAGSRGAATIWDDDGDGTEASWGVPFIAIGVDDGGDSIITGGFWYLDNSVTVQITRGVTVFEPIPVSVQDDWWHGFDADHLGFNLLVGDVVTVTGDDSETVNTHTVLSVTVEWEDAGDDGAGNTVSGTTNAPEGSFVLVSAHDHDASRSTQVGSDGSWIVDFDDPSGNPDPVEIGPGVGGGVQVLDDVGNQTWASWGAQGHGEPEPTLVAQMGVSPWTYGYGFDGMGPLEVRVIEESGLPPCTGVVPFEGGFEVSGEELCGEFGLVGGHHIGVYTPGSEGDLVRDLTVHNLFITAVDVAADSVSGTGTVGVPVQVGIYTEGEFEDESITLALRYVMPDEIDGTWEVFFNEAPNLAAGEFGEMPIDGQEGDARQHEEDGDFSESEWAELPSQMFVNLLADMVFLGQWPAGPDITLEVFESDADDAILVHEETIAAPGPYYVAEVEPDLGGIDLLSGHHVVASNGIMELSHTVTEIAITSFDFESDSFTGTAFVGTTVAADVWNDTSGGSVGDLLARPWIADFTGQVDFSEYNRISGFVGEFDAADNATFFMFEAEYEELAVADGETSVTTADGSVTIENLGEDDEMSIVTGPPPGSSEGFEYVGETLTIESTATGTPGDPLILTLRISGEDNPLDLAPEDIVVFKDGVEVPNCVDTEDEFPCVFERLRIEPSGDIELTVQTLTFSTWATAFPVSVTIARLVATTEPVALGAELKATSEFLNVGEAQGTELTATVSWGDVGGTCVAFAVDESRIEASHVYAEVGVFTPTLRLYAGPADDCGTAEVFELIDETAYQYVVVYDPDGGFVTGGGWIYSNAGNYLPDAMLEGVATFGFVSKYKKGATVPTGNTEFQFQAGDLNFHSSSYDWLVVTGTPTAMFKGVGTINGMGEYKFMIWAGDGEPDTFRIKIWSEDGGVETVIYDNGSAQAIGGGSIIIHKAKK